ncbi:tRNA (adenosine(37)-N6)-threonylcarbamoyltransferase complex transferase subunit TsaD [Lentisphaerota bacterium WC36G]|nr:tRNA (adenosine(37)-N6)-threonylcarbamoyltransferase complex transferase subunit TsaD [Lentisphaerae bacterium WC36]
MTYILGIESSCDETAAAIVKDGSIVISNKIATQIAQHAEFGGVVPELAAREHLKNIDIVVNSALKEANLSLTEISAISVTNGPGLMPALLVGINYAKGLAIAKNLPLIGVNHFFGHIYSAFLDNELHILQDAENFPMLALVVSGGHSSLLLIEKDGTAKVIGATIDDAAGEALDKAAKLLDLGYPGGPIIERLSAQGDKKKYQFPRPLTGAGGKAVSKENRYNFSFSGIKTALLYHAKDLKLANDGENLSETEKLDTVASYQEAVIDVLDKKLFLAVKDFKAKSVVLCGGVACNNILRQRISKSAIKHKVRAYLAEKKYCTDNAAMIAGLGFHYLHKKELSDWQLDAYSRLPQISKVPFI